MSVIASFLVGRNNASTLSGQSIGLSTPEDRVRFLARHRSAAAFIIGKESARRESYSASNVPIFVFSRDVAKLDFPHPMMQQVNVDRRLLEITRLIDQRIEGDIVVEAGASLLTALIDVGAIDWLELTQSPIEGDGHFVDVAALLKNFKVEENEVVGGTRLLKCRYQGNAANG
jgi:riboflavin biosynthesis pyrimidine reductase